MEPLEIYDSINNKHINVYVTSEVAENCREDNAFAQDLFNKLQDQEIEDGSIVEIETIKCEVTDEPIVEENVDNLSFGDKETWGRRETLKLLKAYQSHKSKFKEYSSRKTVWSIIASELAQQGIFKSADKCAEKWKNLTRTYKSINEKPSTPTRFQFLEEMQNIFNNTEIILSDSDSEVEQKYNPELTPLITTPVEEKENWSKYETLKLLKYYQKHKGVKNSFSTEKQFWTVISAELAKDNIHKLPEKCATKWKNLFRSYKKNIEKPSLPLRFQYFQEVSDVVNNVEIQIPDDSTAVSDSMDFEKILDPEQFKCFMEKRDFYVKPRDVASWSHDETLKLIRAYKKYKNRFRMCPSKKYVWAIIVSELARDGIQKEIEKCENKWKSLVRAYRRGMENEYSRFTFHDDIAECLSDGTVNDGEVSTTQNDTPMSQDSTEHENDDLDSDHNTDASDNYTNDGADNNADNTAYEEIIIQTELDRPTESDDNKWSYNETSALIRACASRRSNFKDIKKKQPRMWEEISRELALRDIQKSPESCEKKWRGLFNVYRTHKLNKSGPGKFSFYAEIDNVFKEKEDETDDVEEINLHSEKCKCIKKKMFEKQQRHIERMQLLKRKLDLEERKVEAFEYYVKHLKSSER